jgi:multicomponent Na+:H+ antiporter subunit D
VFPLAIKPVTRDSWSTFAWMGGVVQAIPHAVAKAAMFMAAGLIARALGHDRIARLAGIVRVFPMTVLCGAGGGAANYLNGSMGMIGCASR